MEVFIPVLISVTATLGLIALGVESGKFRGALLRPGPHRDTLEAWNQYSNHPAFINSALS